MKIIKVEYWWVYEKDGIHLCDYEHCFVNGKHMDIILQIMI